MKLVFVVPKGMGDYRKQDIFIDESSHGILSDVSVIPGIGITKELYDKGIKTVKDLSNALENSINPEIMKFKGRFNVLVICNNSQSFYGIA
jgi:hypothetical protein